MSSVNITLAYGKIIMTNTYHTETEQKQKGQYSSPDEIYNEIDKKFNSKPYTGIHKEIFDLIEPRRNQYQDTDAILDYLYCNGFDYLFEE